MNLIRVGVHASDRMLLAGVVGSLEARADLAVVTEVVPERCDVAVLATDRVDADALAVMQGWASTADVPVVLVAKRLSEVDLMGLVARRVMAVIPRNMASAERLGLTVAAVAAGGAIMPSDLLGDLMREFERVHREVLAPKGLGDSGLSTREVAVLRLLADGLDSPEIAQRLNYAERTVKQVIHTMTTRLGLRGRVHAVAYALRAGVIR